MKQQPKDMWNADLYDGNHSFVSEFGHSLIELLAPVKGEQILDVGCGTGDLAQQICQYGVYVQGIDQSENMIQQAQNKYPDIMFKVQDILKLEYNSEFDAVFSNATLHWIKQPKQALHCIYNSLKPGGRFVAEFGGKGNVQIITNEIIHQLESLEVPYTPEQFPWYFPSIGEYTSLMEEIGFNVIFAHHFDRPTPLEGDDGLKNWIEMFAGNLFKDYSESVKEQVISNTEHSSRDILYKNNQWVADYKRLRVIGIK
ncbi:class I SAM-dependent methyltransferase [Gracilibacillus alcaliphilus]|uniref:class I SAM-dependent methyltransferase n=1 Tax=Gracilibacillus alcaliphilus TaxID=1401441 RepID=UPI00195D1193|nr:class I SAM-dependent methyltransferase [Gracilibacillus alcaliphilus]MBM7675716.1 trans-aconitate methyltransferase [Gracilibacillus alcaliphilus]